MEKPDNYVIVTLSGQMDCETISKIRRRMELRECYDEHLRRAFEDPPEKRGPVGYHSSNNLIFPPRDESEPAKPIVSVTITPEEESVFTKLVKGRNGDNKVRLRRFADLYNGGLTWKEIEEQLSISPPTIANLTAVKPRTCGHMAAGGGVGIVVKSDLTLKARRGILREGLTCIK